MTCGPRFRRGPTARGAATATASARAICALGLAAGAALVSADAGGAPGASRVLIVRERSADPVINHAEVRLSAELRAAGFEVEERVVDGDEDARQLVEEPGVEGPFATVLLRRAGGRAATDVWVADHVTHKTVVRRIGAHGGDGSDRALALRVVELMRASLVEPLVLPAPEAEQTASATAPQPAPAPGPPLDVVRWTREAIREPAPPTAPRLGLAFGVVGVYAGPDVAPAVGPALRVTWHATPTWSLGVFGASAMFGGDVAPRLEGTASLRQDLGLLEIGFEYPANAAMHLLASAGMGAYHLYARGNANAGFTSLHDDTWTGLGAVGVGVRWRVASAASVVVDARELLALPRPVVEFASERVASAMRPGTLAAISLAVDL